MTTAICISALNEEATIFDLVRMFADLPVFVIDNGSTDATYERAVSAGATVYYADPPLDGLGACLMLAWRFALDSGCDSVLQIDAGGSHDPEDSLAFFEAAYTHNADLIIGSRFMQRGRYINGSLKRRFMSRFAAFMMNCAQHGAHYSDWTSGYRYFSERALRYLLDRDYIARMHGWQMEVLAYAGELGLKIVEVPITYTAGRSSFNRRVAHEAFQVFLHVMHHVGAVVKEDTSGSSHEVNWNADR